MLLHWLRVPTTTECPRDTATLKKITFSSILEESLSFQEIRHKHCDTCQLSKPACMKKTCTQLPALLALNCKINEVSQAFWSLRQMAAGGVEGATENTGVRGTQSHVVEKAKAKVPPMSCLLKQICIIYIYVCVCVCVCVS